jgi:2-amino-4-hydroxy-6-hydroxymethyldihydropteridine diphosphokinase
MTGQRKYGPEVYPPPACPSPQAEFSVEAWIGLGSNLGDPASLVIAAMEQLSGIEKSVLTRCSGLYRSAPWGGLEQDDFFNAVAVLDTTLSPHHLLRELQLIENHMGRKRSGLRWGPRCIDLDLLTYNDEVIHSPELELPHPRMHLRAFVLCPILELDPDFYIPGKGRAANCLAALEPVQEISYSGPSINLKNRGE